MKRPRITREFECSWLYSDGTLVQSFSERRDGIRIGETIEITQGYADISMAENYAKHSWYGNRSVGGICIPGHETALLALMKGATVEAIAPSIEGGSENTKKAGVSVGYLKIKTRHGWLTWTVMDRMISGIVTIQCGEQWAPMNPAEISMSARWGNSPIVKVTDLRKKSNTQEVAA